MTAQRGHALNKTSSGVEPIGDVGADITGLEHATYAATDPAPGLASVAGASTLQPLIVLLYVAAYGQLGTRVMLLQQSS